ADALAYWRAQGAPIVVKADGLAAGKGVVVATTLREAEDAIAMMFEGAFGAAGAEGVIEEFLSGREISFFALCDGETAIALATAQDYKRVFDHDEGPNTGGMGAYSPLPWLPDGFVDDVIDTGARPTVRQLAAEQKPFIGLLYCGLIVTSRGVRVIEFNARFGDPETQVVLPRLVTPPAGLLHAAATGDLGRPDGAAGLRWRPGAAVTVVIAAQGYPERPVTGQVITGLEQAERVPDTCVLQAGTTVGAD